MDVFETVSQKCSVTEGNVNSRSTVLVSSPIDSYKNHLLALLRAQSRIMAYRVGTTRIYHECEGWIEKFVLRIALTTKGLLSDENSDPEGQIFLSHSHTNNRFFFLLIIRFTVFILRKVLLLWIFYVFVLSCVCYVCARLFICASWSPAGKGLTSWLSFVVSSVSLSLSLWYPGSGVVLDCIDS